MRTARRIPEVKVIARHRDDCKFSARDGKPAQAARLSCGCPKQLIWWKDGRRFTQAAPVDGREAEREADQKQEEFRKLASGIVEEHKPDGAALLLEVIESYLHAKQGKVRTLAHVAKLRFELNEFERWCSERGLMQVAAIGLSHLIAYRTNLQRQNYHQNTLNKKCDRIIGFFEYLVRIGTLPRNIARSDDFRISKAKARPPKALSDEQYEAALAAVQKVDGRTTDDKRRKLRGLVVLMRWSGMSIRDALRRQREDFTRVADGSWRASIERSKTGHTATIVLKNEVMLEVFACGNKDGFLFIDAWPETEHGQARLVGNWGWLLAKVSKRASLGAKFTAHVLRHTFARAMFDKGISTEDVARLLGDSPEVVGRYYSVWIKAREERLAQRVLAALA